MMTSRGKLQRIACNEISVVGRNTQGVRIMKLDESDSLAAVVRVPPEDDAEKDAAVGEVAKTTEDEETSATADAPDSNENATDEEE